MKVTELTNAQLMILCRGTDCEECSFLLHEVSDGRDSWMCQIMEPRHWKENEDDRSAPIQRDGYVTVIIHSNGHIEEIPDLDIPEAWERLLEAEHQLMLSLLEVKP